MILFLRRLLLVFNLIGILICIPRDTFSDKEIHHYFLNNSPYKKSKNLSRNQRKAFSLPPNAYNERFYELTMNPSLGYPTLSKKVELQNRLISLKKQSLSIKSKTNNASRTPGENNLNPWVSIGPNNVGGRTRGALFDLNDPEKDRVIAGGVSGGLWVNEDIDKASTSPWTKVNGVPGNLAVSVIVQNPNDQNQMYLGTGESYTGSDAMGNGIYKSNDYGQNWTMVFGNFSGTVTTTVNENSETNSVEGYFYINDLQIWDPTPNNTSNNDEYIYAIFGQGQDNSNEYSEFYDLNISGLYVSTNHGANWTKLALPLNSNNGEDDLNDIEVDPNNNKLWVSATRNQYWDPGSNFYYSTDGSSFTKVSPTFPTLNTSNIGRVEIAPSSTHADKFYILLATTNIPTQAEIFKTTDGFNTLTKMPEPDDADVDISSTDFTRNQSFYDLEIEVDPNDDDIVYVGGINLFRSTNGGTSWTQISKWADKKNMNLLNVSLVHADQHGIYFKPGDSDKGIVVNDGGVYYASSLSSASSSNVFKSQESGFVTTQFYKVAQSPLSYTANDYIFGGSQDNGTLSLDNSTNFSGLTGSTEFTGGDGGFPYIDQINTKYQISNYIYNDAVYLKSLAGTTYSNGSNSIYLSDSNDDDSSDDTEGDFINPGALDSNLDILYTNGSKSNSFKIRRFFDLDTNSPSDNYITGLPNSPSAFHVSTHTSTSTTLLVGTDHGEVLLIKDANSSSNANQIGNFIGSVSNLKFGSNEQEIYVTLYNYGVDNILYSVDGGANWDVKDGNLPDLPVLAIQRNPYVLDEVIVGTDLGVWKTTNFSAVSPNWTQSNNGMTDVRVNDFEIRGTNAQNNRVLASTYGRGIFTGSFKSGDITSPNVVLTDTDLDNIVSNSNVVTITANFSESMSPNPTISLTGVVSNQIMTAKDSALQWTYTWIVSVSSVTSTIATVSGTDLAGNNYIGSESITFTIYNPNPFINQSIITNDNNFVSITFSEPVFGGSALASTTLAVNDFYLSISGGVATLNSQTPSSISIEGSVITLGLPLSGVPSGQEIVTVTPVSNSIFNASGSAALTTQSNNSVGLNGDSDGDGLIDALDQCPNTPNGESVDGNGCAESQKDLDNDGVTGLNDNCPNTANPNQSDIDNDGIGDACDPDDDNDGLNDTLDQCPNTPNGEAVDGNGCAESQKDPDNDGVTGLNDNCPNTANSNQSDIDSDGIGDACDIDIDGDGVLNIEDNCPRGYNPPQLDNDNDGQGDICDPDDDNDGYLDSRDYFPLDPTEWFDTDLDGIGNNADTDDDNDSYLDTEDEFPLNPEEWLDTDIDGIGNNLDKDDDNDNVIDRKDAFPLDSSEWLDTDSDGIGNNTDQDDDGDGYSDLMEIECESSPIRKFFIPSDYDNDLIADCIDPDDDNDGCLDEEDPWPYNENACADADGDGISDYYDSDKDNDGISNERDLFPYDPNESIDTDGDGIGDNADPDDNNDGFPEDPVTNQKGEEVIPLFVSELITPNQSGVESKWRIVNIEKYPTANVKVYSTNWNIVYESWSYKNDWDGKAKDGNMLPSGSYYYIIDRGDETTAQEGWLYIFN
jgi:gliding motility-associated-like protein